MVGLKLQMSGHRFRKPNLSWIQLISLLSCVMGTCLTANGDNHTVDCDVEVNINCQSIVDEVVGPQPKCGDAPCGFVITGWQAHPTNPSIEIPKIEYRCPSGTVKAHDIDTSSYTNCTGEGNPMGVQTVADAPSVTCFYMKICALECTPIAWLRPENEWPSNRWKEGSGGSGDPGKTEVYEARCNNGVGTGTPHTMARFTCVGAQTECLEGEGEG